MPLEDEVVIGTSTDGTRQLVYSYAIDGYPWNVIVTTPIREVQRQALQIATQLSLVILVVGVLLIGLVYAMSRRLTAPLRLMADVAQSITGGDLAQSIYVVGEDEIGQLASSFEEMRQSLKARLDEMDLLLTVSQNVASSFELSEILPTILSGVSRITNADLSRLVLLPSLGLPGAFQFGEDPGNWAVIDPQILTISAERGRFMLENPARARAVIDFQDLIRPIEALIALPIQHEDVFVGALWLGHVTPRTFTPDQINLLSILATQLGIAVANADLYQQVEQERSRLMAVLEWSPDAFLLIDREGKISLVNPAAAGLLVGNVEQALGMPAAEHIANSKLVDFLLSSDQELRTMEIELDPGRVMFASVSDIMPEGGEVSGRLCVLRDITHYKKLDSLKSEFVSTVSHDLRAPLTLLRGYATMLSMVGSMSDQQKEFMDKIHSSVDQMDNLVDNLLDLGRIEAGLGLELGRVKIEPLIDEVINAYRPQAVNKKISLEVDMAHDMEEVEVDTPLIRQAVGNLLDNALRYTPAEGRVTVRVYQHNARQVISISDTGVGIAPTDQARLFEKFYRAPRLDDDREGGLGLGLAIVKSIVDQHGGSVAVESRLGSGTTFTIEIPVRSRLHIDQDSSA
jgi:PAS domain S-box-containing protein